MGKNVDLDNILGRSRNRGDSRARFRLSRKISCSNQDMVTTTVTRETRVLAEFLRDLGIEYVKGSIGTPIAAVRARGAELGVQLICLKDLVHPVP